MDKYLKNKELIISIVIPLVIGFISSLLSLKGIRDFATLELSFVPPGFIFTIVWTILYILMGISSYLIYDSSNYHKECCLQIYFAQLLVNGIWSLIFFNLKLYLFSFIWIILLIGLIIYMMICFYGINKKAALLNIPYLLWCLYAAYLSLNVYFTLN